MVHGRRVHPIKGDASCYFRAVSFSLFGTEDNDMAVRTRLVRFVNLNQHEEHLMPGVNESTIIDAHVNYPYS